MTARTDPWKDPDPEAEAILAAMEEEITAAIVKARRRLRDLDARKPRPIPA